MSGSVPRQWVSLVRLFGETGLARLAKAHVVVVGIGGVGSWAAEALARSGVGRLTLIDGDVVSESNLNRQVQATAAAVGLPKGAALASRLKEIVPEIAISVIDDWLTADEIERWLMPSPDAVLDACDDRRTKVALAVWARAHRVPCVLVGAAGGKDDPTAVRVVDLAKAAHDPLLARVRADLRRYHGFPRSPRAMGVTVVTSSQPMNRPANFCEGGKLSCAGYGSVVTVTATMGLVAAQWVISTVVR
ncbi:MAG: tRNA threonylcarbamoyladenosine dehydratase [Hydrogenophilus sp.]|nr:tRNA threonylcarbamoyladenosine dehydratase [Hydrogenophilus sp.]